ncbi:hypothetical protein LSH36_84g07024 [Paralvinella palmiformis]|uniref:Uncharacterized protein n=1 Tax=Paralvinella palmiformis TaxID=53620 RepID=A0AAD9K1H7_9ANNE|nr:hypothetical protein LSH36_84g07024 [Paralvinella palmiformis]
MSRLNDTLKSYQTNNGSGWLPCPNTATNGTELANSTDLCQVNSTGEHSQSRLDQNIKTFHMRKEYRNPTDLYVGAYDPANGIRTACILGSFLLFVTVYIIYKAKCKKNRWTSSDKLFIEKYKQKLAEKEFCQKSTHRKSFHEMHIKQEIAALEATAKWIQSQPLDLVPAAKKKLKQVNVCNVCLQALDTPSCPMCSKSQSRVSMETSCTINTTWALNSHKHQTQEKLGLVSLALNSTKDVVQVPLYKKGQYDKNDHTDKDRWKNNFLKDSCNLDGKLKKYSNVEYLNLHTNNPEASSKDDNNDQKCIRMDVAKLLGAKSYEYMANENSETHGFQSKEMIPLLQTRRQDSQSSIVSPSKEHREASDDVMANNESKARDPFGGRKSDGRLHPPYHHGSLPTYQLAIPSPNLLSPYHRPDLPSHVYLCPISRPKRSTLSLNLPNTLAHEIPQHGYDTPHRNKGQQRNNVVPVLPNANQINHGPSSWSLLKVNVDGQHPAETGALGSSVDDMSMSPLMAVASDNIQIIVDEDVHSRESQMMDNDNLAHGNTAEDHK